MHTAHRARVAVSVVTVTLVGLGLGFVPATSPAQARDLPSPRTATVRLSASGVHAPDALAAGRYRLHVRAPRNAPGSLQLVKPDRGYTRADLRTDSRRVGRPNGGRAAERHMMSKLRFFGGAEVRAGRSGALWETLYAGRYWLMGGAARRGGSSIETVHVHGTPPASSFPRVSAGATGTDKGLRISRTIPRSGRMLIRNTSRALDLQILVPLKKGATYADFLRWLRRPDGDLPLRFGAARSTALLSPRAGYVLRYRLRPGDYVVLSLTSLGQRKARHVFRPLTVVRRAGTSPTSAVARRAEGFEATPGVVRYLDGWLDDGAPDARERSGELSGDPVRRALRRWSTPSTHR